MVEFIDKLYSIFSDLDNRSICGFNSDGTIIKIYNKKEFSSKILCTFFKSNSFVSFARQLNNYGFKKVSCSTKEHFYNSNFTLDGEKLSKITRKFKNSTNYSKSINRKRIIDVDVITNPLESKQSKRNNKIISKDVMNPEDSLNALHFNTNTKVVSKDYDKLSEESLSESIKSINDTMHIELIDSSSMNQDNSKDSFESIESNEFNIINYDEGISNDYLLNLDDVISQY